MTDSTSATASAPLPEPMSSAPAPKRLKLSPARNQIQWGQGQDHQHRFNRRWEVHMLALLLDKARLHQPLQAGELNEHLLARGQARPLNRSQVQRLVLSLSQWLDDLPGRPWTLEHAPRKASVGPWFLVAHAGTPVQVEVDLDGDVPRPVGRFSGVVGGAAGNSPAQGPSRAQWPAPLVFVLPPQPAATAAADASSPGSVVQVQNDGVLTRLAQWTGQALALLAQHADGANPVAANADPLLEAWQSHPLTLEARLVTQLLRLQWWRQRGDEPLPQLKSQAKQMHEAQQALLAQTQRDPGLAELVRLQGLFNLLMFDADLHAGHVLRQCQQPTPLTADAATQLQWHSLRARASWLQAARPDPGPVPARELHQTCILHLESHMYWGVQLQHPGLLRQGVALAARHLPAMQALGLCSAQAATAWQDLHAPMNTPAQR